MRCWQRSAPPGCWRVRRLSFQSDAIELAAVAGEPLRLAHGFGRPVNGWIVIYAEAPIALHATENSRDALVLVPSATRTVRLVLV